MNTKEHSTLAKYAICLNCADGQVQLPVIQWIKENYGVDYVDVITRFGMDKIVSSDTNIDDLLGLISSSFDQNSSNDIFIVGHDNCVGNKTDEPTHRRQIEAAVRKLKHHFSCDVTGLWISESNSIGKIKI